MVMCQIRLVDGDELLETREMDTVPGIGEEIVVGGEVYQTATTPSDVVAGAAVVYVKRVSDA